MPVVDPAAWGGLITARPTAAAVNLILPEVQAKGSAHSPFLGYCSDQERYWIKAFGQGQLDRALVTEFIVARLGRMIGACVPTAVTVGVDPALAGWDMGGGRLLQAGVAHGMAEVPNAVEERPNLLHRARDDNARRQVGIYALFDWFVGSDQQWLHDTGDDYRIYSADHGWFLPPSGPDWSIAALQATVAQPHVLPDPPAGLDPGSVDLVAGALDNVDRASLAAVLSGVPAPWPASDNELEVLGWFLESRAKDVAERLRHL